ncbi:MAG: HD domain-containing protein [Ignavibacteriales bacterium]|nr:HD domain-containing protein [Ignavibacteriales bacterium]MCB9258149.1 HD domain-containing protein [Ignavibacteriales bacterium]
MDNSINYKEIFLSEREKLFSNKELFNNSYQFCIKHSLLVEEFIIKLIQPKNFSCVMAAVGGFSRRELSPFSDIDLMFIFPSLKGHESEIQHCVTTLWDAGIEVSHTVREFSDIEKYLKEDLHAFTQFFETRFLLGSKNLYDEWNAKLFQIIEKSNKSKLVYELFEDVEARYIKYGRSPKVLEPNVKFTGGGLRDIHAVEWMYAIKNQKLLSRQDEITQTEVFIKELLDNGVINRKAYKRLYDSYKNVLRARNMLHLVEGRKNDRLEFIQQEQIAEKLGYPKSDWKEFMYEYFRSSTILNRFSKTMRKRYKQEFSTKLSDYLLINLDDDFEIKGDILRFKNDRLLNISDIMRAFYYRGLNDASFEQNLRSLIIESIHLIEETNPPEATSSVFFRELLRLPSNVGKTLLAMNEFSFLDILLPEFKSLNGFFQPGVYHCYTADEHTLIALQNLENLSEEDNHLARLFKSLHSRDLLYMAVLLHDIGKPISIAGHEIIGAEIVNSIMQSLGYGQSEILLVQFLVKHHLDMEQIAFRRDLNDPTTLDNFISIFPSIKALDHLYLLSYADLSAVNPKVWTQWKAELLKELYTKAKSMLQEQLSGEELISAKSNAVINDQDFSSDNIMVEHLDQVDNLSYVFHFTQEEINQHIEEIEKGSKVSVFFKESESFTNITVVTKDSEKLLARLCGALAINDLNIHDAKIFTRKDGIIIDSFNVSDFRTNELISNNKYSSIEKTIAKSIVGDLNIEKEFEKVKSKWKRIINNKIISPDKIEIDFEEHDKFTIIDIYAPDKIGLLYSITHKMAELGLTVAFAKISTKVDGVLDAFYIQKNNGEKLRKSEYGFINSELTEEIKKIL